MWLLDGEIDLEAECAALHDGEAPPYWAFCWGSGQALARFLLDHPEQVRGLRVVDLGCGSGVAGIAAARAGAASVVAVDRDPLALEAARANAASNGVDPGRLRTARVLPEDWDVLLAADLLYETALRPSLAELCRVAETRGARILAAEPNRPGNPGHAASPLAHYEARTVPDVDSPTTTATIYCL